MFSYDMSVKIIITYYEYRLQNQPIHKKPITIIERKRRNREDEKFERPTILDIRQTWQKGAIFLNQEENFLSVRYRYFTRARGNVGTVIERRP